ncbi:uncharacterized protein [Apostichopus japonicus]|uniref:uncharacterized protein n=1 Tax=Stichopus japonicus TaxID=307972 RepID=UPI003AB43DC5
MARRNRTKLQEMTSTPVGTDELVSEIMKELTENGDFKNLLQNCIEKAINRKLSKLSEEQERQEAKIFELENQLETAFKDIKTHTKYLADMKSEIEKNSDKMNDLDQYSRKNCVRVFGIKENANEKPTELLINLAKNQLGVDITPSSIDRAHRVGTLIENRIRAIIVKFQSHKDCKSFIKNRRKLKGSGIVIKEDLTHHNQQLLKATQNHDLIESAWTSDGKILAIYKKRRRKKYRS